MRVDFTVACINHKPLKIRLINQGLKQPFPYATIAPANKAPMGIAPSAEVGRQIAPWRTSTHDPKNCIDKTPIVMRYAAPSSLSPRQKRLKFFPNGIRNVVSSMCGWRHGFLAYG
jgi:hypothetical protein